VTGSITGQDTNSKSMPLYQKNEFFLILLSRMFYKGWWDFGIIVPSKSLQNSVEA
jgi:hypothetical protein